MSGQLQTRFDESVGGVIALMGALLACGIIEALGAGDTNGVGVILGALIYWAARLVFFASKRKELA